MKNNIEAKILSFIGGLMCLYIIDTKEQIYIKPKGIFRHVKHDLKPTVGDDVILSFDDNEYKLEKILERKNSLIRPRVVNIDEVILIQSITEPKFNISLILTYLMFFEIHINNVKIAFSKSDLLKDKKDIEEYKELINMFQNDGYEVFDLNNKNDFQKIVNDLENKVVCFSGNSGVGKSTLLNRIDKNLLIKTQNISKSLNRGKHTTTNVSLIPHKDGFFVDTPGFSSIELSQFSKSTLSKGWHDFFENHVKCKFNDCLHNNEIQCEIKRLVSENKISKIRYNFYLNLINQ